MIKPFCSVSVNTKPHLKKYVEYQYRHFSLIAVTRKNFIGSKLMDFLISDKKTRPHGIFKKTDCSIDFYISEQYMRQYCGALITTNAEIEFNEFLETFFRKDFYDFIELNIRHDRFVNLVNEFYDKLNITEDDISFETLKKSYQRYKQHLDIAEEFKLKSGDYSLFALQNLKKEKLTTFKQPNTIA